MRTAVAGALHHAPVMYGDGRIDQIAPQRPQPRQSAILVGAGKPTVSDHVSGQYCREFAWSRSFFRQPRLAQAFEQGR